MFASGQTLRAWTAVDVLIGCVVLGCLEIPTFVTFILNFGSLKGLCGGLDAMGSACLELTPHFELGTYFMAVTAIWSQIFGYIIFKKVTNIMKQGGKENNNESVAVKQASATAAAGGA